MAPATHGDGKVLTACELDCSDNISNIGTAGDQGRVFIDHAIPYFAGAVIGIIARHDQFTMQVSLEVPKGRRVDCFVKHMMYLSPFFPSLASD
jgi:hypothetical protein